MPPEVLAPNQHENDPTQEMKTPKDQREAETEGENLSMANDDTDICIYHLLCILMYLWRGIGWECAEYAWHMTMTIQENDQQFCFSPGAHHRHLRLGSTYRYFYSRFTVPFSQTEINPKPTLNKPQTNPKPSEMKPLSNPKPNPNPE